MLILFLSSIIIGRCIFPNYGMVISPIRTYSIINDDHLSPGIRRCNDDSSLCLRIPGERWYFSFQWFCSLVFLAYRSLSSYRLCNIIEYHSQPTLNLTYNCRNMYSHDFTKLYKLSIFTPRWGTTAIILVSMSICVISTYCVELVVKCFDQGRHGCYHHSTPNLFWNFLGWREPLRWNEWRSLPWNKELYSVKILAVQYTFNSICWPIIINYKKQLGRNLWEF